MQNVPGIALNEDDGQYCSVVDPEIRVERIESLVNTFADTQVRELVFCVNSMRASYASDVWDRIWKG